MTRYKKVGVFAVSGQQVAAEQGERSNAALWKSQAAASFLQF